MIRAFVLTSLVPSNNIGNHFQIISSFRWCCDADKRLNSIDEIKAHPFFNGVDWQNIRYKRSVFLFSFSIPNSFSQSYVNVLLPFSICPTTSSLFCFVFELQLAGMMFPFNEQLVPSADTENLVQPILSILQAVCRVGIFDDLTLLELLVINSGGLIDFFYKYQKINYNTMHKLNSQISSQQIDPEFKSHSDLSSCLSFQLLGWSGFNERQRPTKRVCYFAQRSWLLFPRKKKQLVLISQQCCKKYIIKSE